jgi:hypothetical protein
MTAYAGSGSGVLGLKDPAADNVLVLPLYEARSIASTSQLNTASLLGEMCLAREKVGGSWSLSLWNRGVVDFIERQASNITKGLRNGRMVPIYRVASFEFEEPQPAAFARNFNWTGVSCLDFSEREAGAWSLSGGVLRWVPALTQMPHRIHVEDPVSGATYIWEVLIASTGAVRCVKHLPGDSSQPALSLRLDTVRGEWRGSYTDSDKIRRSLFGSLLPPSEETEVRARGWLEAGALPGVRTATWWLGP